MTLTLTGYVPDNNVHAAIVAAAGAQILQREGRRQSEGQRRRARRIRYRGGRRRSARCRGCRPARLWSPTARSSSPATRFYDGGGQRRSAPVSAKDFPQGWQYKAEVSVKPAAAPVDATVCQQLFSDLLAKGKIRFESGRATIDPDSAGLLDRLIETALRCPTANIEIAGHTDADGEDAFNQALSEKRAQAVVGLSGQGRAAGRAASRAVGYGSTQPVADNDTDEGKAQNRRIEFMVR